MRTIYLDDDYRCHVANGGTLKAVETDFFDGKCDADVEGYRFVPEGERWMRQDGVVFGGAMYAAWKPHAELVAAQAEYERAQAEAADMEAALDYLFGGEGV